MITNKIVTSGIKYALNIYRPTIPVINYAFLIFYLNKHVSYWFLGISLVFLVWLIISNFFNRQGTEDHTEFVIKMLGDKVTVIIVFISIGFWIWSMYLLYIYRERTIEFVILAVINLVNFVAMLAYAYYSRNYHAMVFQRLRQRRK